MSDANMEEMIIRSTLKKIDKLRAMAKAAAVMYTHWEGFDGGLFLEASFKRRWFNLKVHSEWRMTAEEIELFRDFLQKRQADCQVEADNLANKLKGFK